jgi:hypothetical protein
MAAPLSESMRVDVRNASAPDSHVGQTPTGASVASRSRAKGYTSGFTFDEEQLDDKRNPPDGASFRVHDRRCRDSVHDPVAAR